MPKKYNITRKAYNRGVKETSLIESLDYKLACDPNESGGSGPSDCLPYDCDIHNIMGQEDLFRESPPGTRVLNYRQGRIVFTTGVPTTAYIEYSSNDVDLDINTGILNPSDPKRYHEWFIPDLDVDSLYAFRVTAQAVNDVDGNWAVLCPDPIVSGIYYFTIGGQVAIIILNLTMEPTLILVVPDEILCLVDTITGSADHKFSTTGGELNISVEDFSKITPTSQNIDIDETFFFTTNQINLVP